MPMIKCFTVHDEIGRVLTKAGFWSFEDDDAVEFTREDDAIEVADEHPGTTVEMSRRYVEPSRVVSTVSDLSTSQANTERTAA